MTRPDGRGPSCPRPPRSGTLLGSRLFRGSSVLSALTLIALGPATPPLVAVTPAEMEELWRSGHYRQAESAARALVAELEQSGEQDPLRMAEALDLLVEASSRCGRAGTGEILVLARQAVSIKETFLGPSDPRLAPSLLRLAVVHRRRAEYSAAEAALDRAGDLAETAKLEGELPLQVLEERAQLDHAQGRLAEARSRWEEALRLEQERHGPEAAELYGALVGLAAVLDDLGEREAALGLLARGVSAAQRLGEDHPDYALALGARGGALWRRGEYQRSRLDYERAVAILELRVGEPSDALAAMLNGLSLALRYTAERTPAIDAGQRALAMQEELLDSEHPAIAESLNNLGGALAELGDFASSRRHFERALAIRQARFAPEHPLIGQTHANLARVDLALEDPASARRHYERALEILGAAYGEEHPRLAVLLSGLAQLDAAQGRYAEARAGFERVLEIRQGALGPDHPLVALDLRLLSEVARLQGDFEASIAAAARALHIREERFGPRHPDVAAALSELAAVELLADRRAAALEHAVRSGELLSRHLADTLATLGERQALLQIRNLSEPEETLFSGLLSAQSDAAAWLEACWRWTIRRRGRVLEEMATRHRWGALGASPEAKEAWLALAAARQELADLLTSGGSGGGDAYRQGVEEAYRRKELAEAALSRASPDFAERSRQLGSTLEDVRGSLPRGAALVEIVRVPVIEPGAQPDDLQAHDVALVLGASREPSYVDLGRSEEVDRLVAHWRRTLDATRPALAPDAQEEAGAEVSQAGEALRQLLWDAVAPRIGDAEMVFWVLDGALHQVPIDALPARDGGYLVESPPAHHLLGAARDLPLFAKRRHSSGARGILAMGAPDFDAGASARRASLEGEALPDTYRGATSRCPALVSASWRPLPEAYRELLRIGRLFEDREAVRLLHGPEASEERLELEAPGKRVLHLATHGFFLPRSCRDDGLYSPLTSSGLVLAGANRPREEETPADDGLVTAEELAALDLTDAELVVLSACDTGRGDIESGEGIFGLRRALHIAGARSVVMSLWPVPDTSARRWMGAFYGALESGSSLLDASREASLVLLERLRRDGTSTHPHLWAGFVAAGDWR